MTPPCYLLIKYAVLIDNMRTVMHNETCMNTRRKKSVALLLALLIVSLLLFLLFVEIGYRYATQQRQETLSATSFGYDENAPQKLPAPIILKKPVSAGTQSHAMQPATPPSHEMTETHEPSPEQSDAPPAEQKVPPPEKAQPREQKETARQLKSSSQRSLNKWFKAAESHASPTKKAETSTQAAQKVNLAQMFDWCIAREQSKNAEQNAGSGTPYGNSFAQKRATDATYEAFYYKCDKAIVASSRIKPRYINTNQTIKKAIQLVYDMNRTGQITQVQIGRAHV